MVISFNDDYLELMYSGEELPGKPRFDDSVIKKFRKTILILEGIENVSKIHQFKGLNFEGLKGNLKGFYSVRVDKKYRLILSVQGEEFLKAEELIVEDLTNHYK
ncbi:MAG: type II toxin-antitoxin system RelE/ParE family toxin [Lewinellaceae bacterium]|nr:type II toxin-antitoxin system RelE/ParE family toxin [Lewinellaceae bacterium]